MSLRLFSDVRLKQSEKLQIKVRSSYLCLTSKRGEGSGVLPLCVCSAGSQQAEGGAEDRQGEAGEASAGGAEAGGSVLHLHNAADAFLSGGISAHIIRTSVRC